MSTTPMIERAFQLARSGKYHSLSQITQVLKIEKYPLIEPHMASRSLRKQLTALMQEFPQLAKTQKSCFLNVERSV